MNDTTPTPSESPDVAYRFTPYGGEGYVRSRPRPRRHLLETLQNAGASLDGDFARWNRLTRDAAALRPAVRDELETRIEALRLAFDVEWAAQDVDVAELLDDLVLPFVRSRVPLRPRAEATAWAHETILRVLERFDAFGVLYAHTDRDGRRTSDSPNPPAVIVRVALAAGWLAWSDVLVDRGTARTHLNVLIKAIDAIDAGMHRHGWKPTARELDVALAALVLERRLLRHGRCALSMAY